MTSPSCVSRPEHCADLLPAYVNATLAESERRLVSAHLRQCAPCRARLDAWVAIGDAAKADLTAKDGPDGDPRAAVRSALAQATVPSVLATDGDAPRKQLRSTRDASRQEP